MATGYTDPKSQQETSEGSRVESEEIEDLIEAFGQCKWFNSKKGYGFVTPETKPGQESKDIFVHQSNIKMEGFRSLREGESVRLWYRSSQKGLEAVKVEGCGGDSKSSGKIKRRRQPDRCYNCGVHGHHAKQCDCPTLPKRCHHCNSVKHLVADCPIKQDLSCSDESKSSHNTSSS
uniref:Uncharacterized protein n=1 Tax=Ciona savignyi TaxID=51511 RepID=H2Z0Q0_CIOSA